jgi:heme-degrading monooxygenase HmoA
MSDNVDNFGNTVFRVMLRMRIWPGMEDEFEQVWHEVGSAIAKNPANVTQWLCRSETDAVYYIISDWVGESEFREFETSDRHREFRQMLQPYRASGSMTTMQITMQLAGAASAATQSPRDGGVRALVYYATQDSTSIEKSYHQVSRELAGVPGLCGNELLHSVHDPTRFIVLSRWSELAAFQQWESGSSHRNGAAPMRRFEDTRLDRPFGLYRVEAEH